MLTALFAQRTSWIGLLFFLLGVFALWFVYRAIVDTIVWFREEVLDDIREKKRKARYAAEAEKKVDDKREGQG